MKVGFIGLGNVGSKLAGSLVRNGHEVVVRDLNEELVRPFREAGAHVAASPREMMERCELVITCLPSPTICAQVVEGPGGLLEALGRRAAPHLGVRARARRRWYR